MARLLWSLLCRRALIDETFKAVSLIDVVEGIDVRPPPGESLKAFPMELASVTLWTRNDAAKSESSSSSSQRIRVVGPDGSESAPVVSQIDLSGHRNWRNIVHFQGFTFRGQGDYAFVIELGAEPTWVEHARVILQVNVVADKG